MCDCDDLLNGFVYRIFNACTRKVIRKKESTKPSKTINRSNRSDKTKQTHQSKLDNEHIKQKPKKHPYNLCMHRFLKDRGSEVANSVTERKKKQNANSANKENYGDFVLIFRNSDLNMNAIVVCVYGCNFGCCRLLFGLCCVSSSSSDFSSL